LTQPNFSRKPPGSDIHPIERTSGAKIEHRNLEKKSEGGLGGERGHSNMNHWEPRMTSRPQRASHVASMRRRSSSKSVTTTPLGMSATGARRLCRPVTFWQAYAIRFLVWRSLWRSARSDGTNQTRGCATGSRQKQFALIFRATKIPATAAAKLSNQVSTVPVVSASHSTTTGSAPPPNSTLKLSRPGFGPAAEPPRSV
jgi:hypothetical protein